MYKRLIKNMHLYTTTHMIKSTQRAIFLLAQFQLKPGA